ncbi:MAG: hypothetical protein A4E68_00130 [Syntrophaceae bacterium PtaB.Bin095]|jgi:hypothetical protein|nr:MAG: hypothetical protein A4E68_00130 [Syntrophaceae bacterium PtaB.Bin095]
MRKLDAIQDIKMKALYIEQRFRSNRPDEMDAAERELVVLRERFCEENGDFITPPMARALKKDFDTFLALIDWACQHWQGKEA